MEKFTFIDLFCGIGGFHQAMEDLGGECLFASDIDEDCQKTYEKNYNLKVIGDITKVDEKDIPAHDVLCGGFPCQSFSKAGNRLGFADPTKGTLFFDIMRIARYHHPKYMLLENVRNLASHDGGNTWRVIREEIEKAGYNLLPMPIIFSPHQIGIPQHRERVFIMCIRKDLGDIPEFYFEDYMIPRCSIDSILIDDDKIPNLNKYQLSQDIIDLIDIWNEFVQNIKGKLPGFPVWADCLCPMEDNPFYGHFDEQPTWCKTFIKKNHELWLNNRAFIDDWLPRAKKLPKFFGAKAKLEWQAGAPQKPDLWNTIMHFRPSGLRCKEGTYFPALVAITQTSIVGKRKRFLTPRECARLQSFPDSFKCSEKDPQAYKQFGNAVNVECVKLFAKFMFGDPQIRAKYTRPHKEKELSLFPDFE